MLVEQEQVCMNVWAGIDRLLDVSEWDAATRVGEREAQQEAWRVAKERRCNENITRYLGGSLKSSISKM